MFSLGKILNKPKEKKTLKKVKKDFGSRKNLVQKQILGDKNVNPISQGVSFFKRSGSFA